MLTSEYRNLEKNPKEIIERVKKYRGEFINE